LAEFIAFVAIVVVVVSSLKNMIPLSKSMLELGFL
jgi:hypothetical protein